MPNESRTRALRWLASSRGRAIAGVVCLLLATFMAFAYAQSHKLILLVFTVGIFAIAVNEWVQAYRRRNQD